MFSFVPGVSSFVLSSFLLFSSPLTQGTVIYAFSGLMISQLITLRFDYHCVKNGMAPLWFEKYRTRCFGIYMFMTAVLFGVYFTRIDQVQRTNDPNRIA
mmetsp:Transcript_5038/g.8586  ORF Transcript_5038/g.8586 Transcript_5038/m.8586 type:complete len:99 (+) Transcript_5038:588-884(+)